MLWLYGKQFTSLRLFFRQSQGKAVQSHGLVPVSAPLLPCTLVFVTLPMEHLFAWNTTLWGVYSKYIQDQQSFLRHPFKYRNWLGTNFDHFLNRLNSVKQNFLSFQKSCSIKILLIKVMKVFGIAIIFHLLPYVDIFVLGVLHFGTVSRLSALYHVMLLLIDGCWWELVFFCGCVHRLHIASDLNMTYPCCPTQTTLHSAILLYCYRQSQGMTIQRIYLKYMAALKMVSVLAPAFKAPFKKVKKCTTEYPQSLERVGLPQGKWLINILYEFNSSLASAII